MPARDGLSAICAFNAEAIWAVVSPPARVAVIELLMLPSVDVKFTVTCSPAPGAVGGAAARKKLGRSAKIVPLTPPKNVIPTPTGGFGVDAPATPAVRPAPTKRSGFRKIVRPSRETGI